MAIAEEHQQTQDKLTPKALELLSLWVTCPSSPPSLAEITFDRVSAYAHFSSDFPTSPAQLV